MFKLPTLAAHLPAPRVEASLLNSKNAGRDQPSSNKPTSANELGSLPIRLTLKMDPSPPAQATGPTDPVTAVGAQTLGTGPISKRQPWRDIIQPQAPEKSDFYFIPDFFRPTPSVASANKIRLLAEVDNKGR
ncbi:hypothetical protein B0T25DRAFT_563345 [Lasiosphaeria hispida]|uniref:Uncharacterized protein n=1 Tax=Lasiosphaeria hispida TaxID=260671 RepID=A0AAJ0ML67_9PEZI|nr:hypothetical protein B0T25DRAFT_563345 [Lasiosphaeria hispida]